ncbi:MAG TPA: LuxR C-terminal-related transcriptional regulator [Ferruginibacter sp.]|nr:LuxR C-terminal-related transcriptional regulator [Ferruginibacter sp.]
MRKTETPLTRREKEVLALLAKGSLYKEIAQRLSISLDTVKKHCKNIYQKLNVRNRTEASNHFNSRKAA